jgi:uncharacterized membrane protein
MTSRVIAAFLLVGLAAGSAFAQQPGSQQKESTKSRKILTAVGAGGGFVAGVFVGIDLFDDAINSDRKVWGTAILGAGAGAVGGYLLGRTIDRGKRKTTGLSIPLGNKDLEVAPVAGPGGTGVRFAMQF